MKLKTISRVVYYLCIWSTQPWTEKHECRVFRSEKKQGYASFNVWEMSALPWTSLLLFRWNKQGNKCVLLRWGAFWEPRKCILILMPLRNALLQGIHFLEEVLMFSYRNRKNKQEPSRPTSRTNKKRWLDVLIAFLRNKVVYSTHFLP